MDEIKFTDEAANSVFRTFPPGKTGVLHAQLALLLIEVWGEYYTKHHEEAAKFALDREYFGAIFNRALNFRDAMNRTIVSEDGGEEVRTAIVQTSFAW